MKRSVSIGVPVVRVGFSSSLSSEVMCFGGVRGLSLFPFPTCRGVRRRFRGHFLARPAPGFLTSQIPFTLSIFFFTLFLPSFNSSPASLARRVCVLRRSCDRYAYDDVRVR
jgi:hypothetical protein